MVIVGRHQATGRAGVHVRWLCRCDCGQEFTARSNIIGGTVISCPDCARRRRALNRVTHGRTVGGKLDPTYYTWSGIIARCRNPATPNFYNYGGRGVSVCERWLRFENFLADMGERPPGSNGGRSRFSIDRIDNDGNYEPGNCRWATSVEQSANRRCKVLSWDLVQEIRGRREHGEGAASIAQRLGIRRNMVHSVTSNRSWTDSKNPLIGAPA